MITTNERGLSCEPVGWEGDGSPVLQHDDQHANRYEVRKGGDLIGYITADPFLRHPDVRWKQSRVRGSKTEELQGEYETVEAALAAF